MAKKKPKTQAKPKARRPDHVREFEQDLRDGVLTDPRNPDAVIFEPEHDGETFQW